MNAQVVNAWRNKNKHLFYLYPEKWVAYTPELGIIADHDDVISLSEIIKQKGLNIADCVLKFVHESELPYKRKRILPIRVRGVRKKEWSPDYTIEIKHGDRKLTENMLIDSGADISVISKRIGELLGLTIAPSELFQEVAGVGGGIIEYASRKITFVIDDFEIVAPVAWLQDDAYNELIIGREVIFDKFDIEFKQADEQIIFKPRTEVSSNV